MNVNQTQVNSPNAVQVAAQNVTINADPSIETRRHLGEHIRAFLNNVNPDIVRKVDAGEAQIIVYLSQTICQLLFDLAGCPEFARYLQVQPGKKVMIASSNGSFGDGGIMDRLNDGMMRQFVLHVHAPLRKDGVPPTMQ